MKYATASIVALAGSAASSPLAQRLPGFLPLELTQNLPAPKANPVVPASFLPVSKSPANPFSTPKIDSPLDPNFGKSANTAPAKTIDPFLEKPNVPTWWPILKIPIPVADTPPATPAASSSPTIPPALLIPAPPSNTWHSAIPVVSPSTTTLAKINTFVTKPVPAAAASWSLNKEHVFSNLYTTITIPVAPDTTFAPSTASSTPKAYHVISSLYTTTTIPAAAKTTLISKTTDKTSWSTSSAPSSPSKNAAIAILPTTSSTLAISYTLTTSIIPTPVAPSSHAPPSSSASSYSSVPLPSSSVSSSTTTTTTGSSTSTTPLPDLETPIPLSPLPAATKQDLSNLKKQLKAVATTLGKTISTFSHKSQKVSEKLKKLRKWSKEDFNSITRLKAVVNLQTQVLVKMKEKIDKIDGENGRLREEVEGIKKEKVAVEESGYGGEGEEKVDGEYSDDEGADGAVEKLVVGSNEVGYSDGKSQQEEVSGTEAPEEQQKPVLSESTAEQVQPVEEYKESYQYEGAYSQEQSEEGTSDGYMYQDDGPGWYDGVWEGEPSNGK